MKQRICIWSLVLLFCGFNSLDLYGQVEETDSVQVDLQVAMPRGEVLASTLQILHRQLEQAVVLNGVASEESPFRLESDITILTCESTPSMPIQYRVELEIYCRITDKFKGQTLQQTTFLLNGVDRTKEKAILSAVKQLKARNPQLKKMIVRGKQKIIDSYCSSSDVVL